jgi:hypothetical protein
MAKTYLEDHPPARSQYRSPRRAAVTGAIVVHTAEITADVDGLDLAAEAIAAFISRRTDGPGSYHSVVDSDTTVRVGRYEWEMYHDGTGGNRWSLGLSFACRAAQWPLLPDQWVAGALRNGAAEAANMARWVRSTVGVVVPGRRITAAEYRAGKPGFVGHGELDPGRRTDPGLDFPWDEFLAYFGAEMAPRPSTTPTSKETLMGIYRQALDDVDALYHAYQGEVEAGTAEHDARIDNLRIWGRDLAVKIVRNGEDPRPTLRFLELHLAAEASK